jgi:PEP-CTERM motif
MRQWQRWIPLGVAALAALSAPVQAAEVTLFEHAFNIDGTVSNGSAPAGVNLGAFDTTTGLGTVTVRLQGAGSRYVGLFADHEIDEAINTFFNEVGSVSGTAAAGQSWEIDEPGYSFGDIYANFTGGALDNTNGVPAGSPDDVSMAMAWAFVLQPDQVATVSYLFSTTAPTSGFYLTQFDRDSQSSIYLSSGLAIVNDGGQVPEPTSWALTGLSLAALALMRRRRAATATAR